MSESNGRAIDVMAVTKTYRNGSKAVRALDGVTFGVPMGTVFGLLGPNGAGKSTTVKILTTLSSPDSGRATVAGVDVASDPASVRRMIGYVPQKPCFDPTATGWENLWLQGRIYGLSGKEIKQRSADLLERFGLVEAADRITKTWSGGMQRKLDVALGLIHQPRVLFLDEPTTGLDPEARTEMWAEISELTRSDRLTVLFTTHYLEEADQLAGRLAIVDRGEVVAEGTPDELKSELDGDSIQIELVDSDEYDRARVLIEQVGGVRGITVEGSTLRATVGFAGAALPGVLAALNSNHIGLASVTAARPSLDDVYMHHAGRAFQTADEAGGKEVSA